MARYRYRAVSGGGEVVSGDLEAPDESAAARHLSARGHMPLRIVPSTEGHAALRWPGRRRHLRVRELMLLVRELATLLGSGLPVDRALALQARLAGKPRLRAAADELRRRVHDGEALSRALRESGHVPAFVASVVEAGEASGALGPVLGRLAGHLERAEALRARVLSALVYPAFLLGLVALSLGLLMTVVVPAFEPLFADAGAALPPLTRLVIGVSAAVRDGWWVALIALLVTGLALRHALAQPAGRARADRLLLRVPLAGPLVGRLETARQARLLATLVGNGVPLVAALDLAQRAAGNAVFAEAVAAATQSVRRGARLGDALAATGVFPDLAVDLVRVGEEGGRLDEMLGRIADLYDEESARALDRAVALLVPVVTVILGVVIAAVIASVLLAMLSANQLAL